MVKRLNAALPVAVRGYVLVNHVVLFVLFRSTTRRTLFAASWYAPYRRAQSLSNGVTC